MLSVLGIVAPIVPDITGGANITVAEAKSNKKEKTKKRVKKLNEIGVPKSFHDYGKDLTLREMGQIIGVWIASVYGQTGQLPSTVTNNPPDWLRVNINGSCISSAKTCGRWEE